MANKIQISTFMARQKVNVLILEQVSNLLLAGDPKLVEIPDQGWVWRIPVDLTFPTYERAGCVGEIDVDARCGKVHYDDDLLARISGKAQELARQTLQGE